MFTSTEKTCLLLIVSQAVSRLRNIRGVASSAMQGMSVSSTWVVSRAVELAEVLLDGLVYAVAVLLSRGISTLMLELPGHDLHVCQHRFCAISRLVYVKIP